MIVDVIIAQ